MLERLGYHPNLAPADRDRLWSSVTHHPSVIVRQSFAYHLALPLSVQRAFAQDREPSVQLALAENGHVDPEIKQLLYDRLEGKGFEHRLERAGRLWRESIYGGHLNLNYNQACEVVAAIGDGLAWELEQTVPEGFSLSQLQAACLATMQRKMEGSRSALERLAEIGAGDTSLSV